MAGVAVDEIQRLFGELFSTMDRDRVVPLEAPARLYRDRTEESRELSFKRRARCSCFDGCATCEHVGWRVVPETIRVKIPAGSRVGTRLRIAGKGDCTASGESRNLQIELVEPGARANALAEDARMHDARLEEWWRREAQKKRDERKQRRFAIVGGLALVAFGTVLLGTMRAQSTPIPKFQPILAPSFTPVPFPSASSRGPSELTELPAWHAAELLPVASVMEPPADLSTRFLMNGLVSPVPGVPRRDEDRADGSKVLRHGTFRMAYAMPKDTRRPTTFFGGVPFWIRRITTNQTPLASAPWHAAGANWTFLEAQLGSTRVTIGTLPRRAPIPDMASYESGEARFVIEGAKARPLEGRVGVFGRSLHRNVATGAYEEADTPGRWTCAKLTLETADDSVEVYVAFDPTERVGEFIAKDADPSPALDALFAPPARR